MVFIAYSEKLVMNGIAPIFKNVLNITVYFGGGGES